MHRHQLGLALIAGIIALASPAAAEEGKKISFKKAHLDPKFRSEGVAVGDFNKDGKLDIAAGWVWYEAPDWKMHSTIEKAPEYDPKAYSNSFQTFAHDVNGDAWTDILIVDFPGTFTWWLENPKEAGKLWKKHELTRVTNNESPQLLDADGDKKPELLFAWSTHASNPDGSERFVGFARPDAEATKPWKLQPVSPADPPSSQRFSHGIGVGDVNKDGINDVIVPQGWWEAPSEVKESGGPWKWHAQNFDCGGGAAQMHAYDFDGDGDNDVLGSSPHGKGIYWFEQTESDKFTKREIDSEYSQTHGVCFADINGDGKPDIITGKRWWAHGPSGDPEPNNPAVLYWYEVGNKDGKATFERHQIDHDSGVGTQFEVADVNGDKLLDIVVSNKKGTFYFEQTRE
jgi:hypothetical protein